MHAKANEITLNRLNPIQEVRLCVHIKTSVVRYIPAGLELPEPMAQITEIAFSYEAQAFVDYLGEIGLVETKQDDVYSKACAATLRNLWYEYSATNSIYALYNQGTCAVHPMPENQTTNKKSLITTLKFHVRLVFRNLCNSPARLRFFLSKNN